MWVWFYEIIKIFLKKIKNLGGKKTPKKKTKIFKKPFLRKGGVAIIMAGYVTVL